MNKSNIKSYTRIRRDMRIQWLGHEIHINDNNTIKAIVFSKPTRRSHENGLEKKNYG